MTQSGARLSRLICHGAVVVSFAFLSPAMAAAQAVGFKVLPSAAKIRWDDALALNDDWLYGGRVSLLFGEQVELQPFFFRGTGIGVDSARARAIAGASAFPRTFDIDHYGATAQVNFGTGDIRPFVRLGGGLVKFSSDSTPERRRVTVLAGGGLRVTMGAVEGELFAEQFQFRLAPARLFSRDSSAQGTSERAPIQRNRAYGASLSIPLSSFPEARSNDALRGTRAPFEPFVGRLRYDSELDLAEQDLVGLRTGLDLNALVGLRGFAWRGVNRDHDATDGVWGYGGEAQFNLNAGSGITPYLVTGAGRIDYDSDFRDSQNRPRQDQTALIVGGGASFSLSERVRVNVSIRDYVTTSDDALVATRNPDDLLHSRLLSAGFTWSLGGQSSPAARGEGSERPLSARDRELERLRHTNDSLLAERARDRSTESMRGDTGAVTKATGADARDVDRLPAMSSAQMRAQRDSTARLIVIPAPTLGEVIIRYGAIGASPTVPRIRPDSARGERPLDAHAAPQPSVPMTEVDSAGIAEQLAAMERRITQHIDDRLQDARTDERRSGASAESPVTPAREPQRVQPRPPDSASRTSFIGRLAQTRPSNMSVLTGFGAGDGAQLVLDARADLGPLSPGSRFSLVPEVAVGLLGQRTTYLAVANLRYDLLTIGGIRPYVMGGAGLFSRTFVGVTTSVGASTDLRAGRGTPLFGFVELQGVNLFDRTRLLFGLSSRR